MKLDLSPYKAAIFDMDGTLVDNMSYYLRAWIILFRKYGITLTDEELRKTLYGRPYTEFLDILFNNRFSLSKKQQLMEEKDSIYREIYHPFVKEVNGLTKVLDQFTARGLTCAVATCSEKQNRDIVLGGLPSSYFTTIVGREDIKEVKPNPEIYFLTAQRLGLMPKQCIAFEDSFSGIEAAKTAGMFTIGLLTTYTKDQLRFADMHIHSYSELEL